MPKHDVPSNPLSTDLLHGTMYNLQSMSTYSPLAYPLMSLSMQAQFPCQKTRLAKRHFDNASTIFGIDIFALLPISHSILLTFSYSI